MQVKIGHGGTLDPLATGVLILGIGSGTKSLNRFLECTKSYETVLLFGAATDSYDTEGKIVARKPYQHVTRELVEEKLERFKGKIMQRPPIFSAKRIQGKRLYEYAREGKELPEGYKIEECPVEVEKLEITEWLEGGTHAYNWPEQEAEKAEKEVADKVLHLREDDGKVDALEGVTDSSAATKRKRWEEDEIISDTKRTKASPEPESSEAVTSGALPTAAQTTTDSAAQPSDSVEATADQPSPTTNPKPPCPAPAVRIRMTVTSGFYVRSLCHDLGAAVGSLGIMAALVRTRQADFELGVNTLWYEDLAQGEEFWGPKVQEMLESWSNKERRRKSDAEDEDRLAKGDADAGWSGDMEGGEDGGRRRDAKPAARARVRRNTSSAEDE